MSTNEDPSPNAAVAWQWSEAEERASAAGVVPPHVELRDGPRRYTALHAASAPGCRVQAHDAASGRLLWETRLQALQGGGHHSKYSNAVQLRLVGGRLAVFGKESSGRYVEVLDTATGAQLYHQAMETPP